MKWNRVYLFWGGALATWMLLAMAGSPGGAAAAAGGLAQHPHIFQYVSDFREGNIHFASVMALSPEQMTVDEGENPLLDGVTLIIPWSILEPKEGRVDFGILDAPLAYWGAKGKQIVLNIAPITFPTVVGRAWGGRLLGGTPDWVMQECETHVVAARLLYPGREQAGPFAMPSPWDPNFEKAYFDLVAQLGRKYDGDPRIAAIRIGTGTEGEENPIFNKGRKNVYVGYTDEKWYGYCRAAVQAHVAAFTKTPLECDLTFAGVVYLDPGGGGRDEVDRLLAVMKAGHVALGCNGFSGEDPAVKARHNAMWQILEKYHDDGYPVALEAGAGLQNPVMWDTDRMLDYCRRVKPVRVNFMGSAAALVNTVEGIHDPRDEITVRSFDHAMRQEGGDPAAQAKKYRDFIVALRQIDLSPGAGR